ncbi:hypothetical protein HanIR_Chr08g0364281 [Helianthus annuus]|nr:hypothetical protein HanIR_Chr08g0364281 [Helianthus annuus]
MALPFFPTNFSHPNVDPASILTRAVTPLGNTLSLYSSLCSSKSSHETNDTTRTAFPSFLSSSPAFTAISSSDPVPIRITSGLLFDESSDKTYPPFSTFSIAVPFRFGSFCLESAKTEGRFVLRIATR